MRAILNSITVPAIDVDLEVYDYTSEGTEYRYDGCFEDLEVGGGHMIAFDLLISGMKQDKQISNIKFWKNGEEEMTLTGEQYEKLHNDIKKSINTNK